MNGQHSSKSISFLMELIFVLLFFTIASAIAVYVISIAKSKNDIALETRNAIFYGENLIEEESDFLTKDQFYLTKDGHAHNQKDEFKISIQHEPVQGLTQQKCTMKIQKEGNVLVTLTFLLEMEDAL